MSGFLFIILLMVPTKLFVLSDSALKNSVRIVGGPGSGKSRLLGRLIAFQTLVRGKPQLILDPLGTVTANLIDRICRLPLAARQRLWPRLHYIAVGAKDYVCGTPLYYRLHAQETLLESASRFPAVLKAIDPKLQSAPILGWNALLECASYAGQIAVALGRQVDFVADLIEHPRLYKEDLSLALSRYPELARAVAYFRQMMDPTSQALRERRTGSFATKLLPFVDPTMLAPFAAPSRGVDWEQVVRQGMTVIVDFQHVLEPERLQFYFIWWFRDFINFIKWRGLAGRGQEVLLIVDEITAMLGPRTDEGASILAEDLQELIARIARNYGVNAILSHQDLSQIDARISNILMLCGTQLVGNIANPDDALYLARQFFRYDPYWVKKYEPVWMSVQESVEPTFSVPRVIDRRSQEFSPDEQLLLAAQRFRLPKFQFLMRPAITEGTIADRLYTLSIENMDRGLYPDDGQVAQVLAFLRQKCGIPLESLLAEIRGRSIDKPEQTQKQVKSEPAPAILSTNSPHPYDASEAVSTDSDAPVSAPTTITPDGEEHHDSFWR